MQLAVLEGSTTGKGVYGTWLVLTKMTIEVAKDARSPEVKPDCKIAELKTITTGY